MDAHKKYLFSLCALVIFIIMPKAANTDHALALQAKRAASAWSDDSINLMETNASSSQTSRSPRVLLIYDMEGLSGVDRESMTEYRSGGDYALGQSSLAFDVNAVIDGLFAGGAAEVVVADRHGSGYDAGPDLPAERLDIRAAFVEETRDTTPLWQREWDGVVLVGMHAASGSGGFLPHTVMWGVMRIVNGRSISESEMFGYQFGEYGIPVLFASGDDVLGTGLRSVMPWVEYVQVKRATSVSSAALRDRDSVRIELRASAQRAMERFRNTRPLRLSKPFQAGLRALPPLTSLRLLNGVPGMKVEDETVTFTAENFDSAWNGWRALAQVARAAGMLDLYSKAERTADVGKPIYDLWMEVETKAAKPR